MSAGPHVATIVRLGQQAPPPPFGPTPAPARNPFTGQMESAVPVADMPLHSDAWDDGVAPRREVERVVGMLKAFSADRNALISRLEALEARLGPRVSRLERPWWRRGSGARRGWRRL